jgi:hypothetical protein
LLFWLCIGIVIAVIYYNTFHAYMASLGEGLMFGFLAALVCSCVVGGVALAVPKSAEQVDQWTMDLKAVSLSQTDGQGGRYYVRTLGRSVDFITDINGAYNVREANSWDTTIYEDGKKPTVTVKKNDHSNGWILPWPMYTTYHYEFHVPAGSVTGDYTIDNNQK